MDTAANHVGFVMAAYLLSFLCLVALATFIIARDRRLKAEVEHLERDRKKVP